jgi:pimeloyl-ACP methyl ester carboxylesterase
VAPLLTQYRGGSGPPLVLLPGLGLTWRSWRPVLGALQRSHDVAALDLPGFGAVPPLARGVRPSPDALADAVRQELDRLGFERPVVAGNSLGGWVALGLALRGRASRVVAIAPSGLELWPERAYVVAANEAMRLRSKLGAPLGALATWPAPARTALLGGLRTRPWRVDPRDAMEEVRSFAHSRGFQPTLRATVATRTATGLGAIRVPVRIAYGTHDLLLGALTAPRFAAVIPGAELVRLPGGGHVPMVDAPALVARTILDFTLPADGGG